MSVDTSALEQQLTGADEQGLLRRAWEGFLDFAYKKPLGIFGGALVAAFVIVAVVGPFLGDLPWPCTECSVARDPKEFTGVPLDSPSSEYWFGTDAYGRDVFSRVVQGAAISLTIAFSVTFINVFMSSFLGLMSGWYMGWVDYVIQRSGEAFGAFPGIIGLILIISIFGQAQSEGGPVWQVAWDMRILIGALSVGAFFGGNRIIRGAVISIKNGDFVMAAKAAGASDFRIMTAHLWPNVVPYVIVGVSSAVGGIIIAESSLNFLGLGVTPGTPSWGSDLSGTNRTYFMQAPWLALAPGLALSFTVLGFNLFGDALRDVLDPRLRGSGRIRRKKKRSTSASATAG